MKTLITLLLFLFLSLASLGQTEDFGYLKFNTFSFNGELEDSVITVFIFNFNDCGDIIAIDERLAPSLLVAQSEYSLTEGMKIKDGDVIYTLFLYKDKIIIFNEETELVFTNK